MPFRLEAVPKEYDAIISRKGAISVSHYDGACMPVVAFAKRRESREVSMRGGVRKDMATKYNYGMKEDKHTGEYD